MLVSVAQQIIDSQICCRNSSTIYQGYSSLFQVDGSSPILERSFWKWDGIFTRNKDILQEKCLFSQMGGCSPLDF